MTLNQLSEAIRQDQTHTLILVSEAVQERRLIAISDEIASRKARMVLLAGPSSSGKTTTSKRLAIQLMACGLRPHTLSTDDYFVNRVDTPRDANGQYDFECIGAVDTTFFQQQMNQLLQGEEIELPRYDFPSGERVFEGKKLQIGPSDVLILEGNHALNPILTQQIPDADKYRIYITTQSPVVLEDGSTVASGDLRLMRRILRDYQYRGYSASETIGRVPSVTAGEGKWITPFRDQAHTLFNSALPFETSAIRQMLEPILQEVKTEDAAYSEAQRLLSILAGFPSLPTDRIPRTSLIREFLGGSSFKY